MLAGIPVQRMTVVRTFLGTDSAITVPEGGWTAVIGLVVQTASGTNFGIIHGFNNFFGTKYLDSTAPVEWIMVRFESFDGTERTGFVRSVVPGRQVRISVLSLGSFISDRFDSYIHR